MTPLADDVANASPRAVAMTRGWLAAHSGMPGMLAVLDLLERAERGQSPGLPACSLLVGALSAHHRPELVQLAGQLRRGRIGPILGAGSVRRLLIALANAVDAAIGHLDSCQERFERLEDERAAGTW